MSFHLAAFFENHDNTANTDVQPLSDDILTIQNNHFFPQRDYDLLFAAVMNADIQRARLVTPTYRQVSLPYIWPLVPAAIPADSLGLIADYRNNPLAVPRLEELALEATHDNVGSTDTFGLIGLGVRRTPAPAGDIWTMRGTSTTASVDSTWTTVVTTWDDTLPAGEYEVVGMVSVSATGVAGRLIFEDQIERPGVPAQTDFSNHGDPMFIKGGLGGWGRFTSHRMPTVQVLNNAATSVHTFFLEFVRIR